MKSLWREGGREGGREKKKERGEKKNMCVCIFGAKKIIDVFIIFILYLYINLLISSYIYIIKIDFSSSSCNYYSNLREQIKISFEGLAEDEDEDVRYLAKQMENKK
jgi:hypothetical protein